MKKLNLITVLSLTAGLAFAWNATAEENNQPQGPGGNAYMLNGDWILPTEGAYGIYYDPYRDPDHTGYNLNGYWVKPTRGAWETADSSETAYTAIANESVLRFSIERNNTEYGFIFGTYALDADGNPILGTDLKPLTTVLGTVTQNGEVGVDGVEKIAIKTEKADYLVDSVYSDAYNVQDLVGVWMRQLDENGDPTGMTYYSQNQVALDYNDSSDLPVFPNNEELLFTQGLLDGGSGPDAILYFDDGIKDALNEGYGYPGQNTTTFVKIRIQGAAPGKAGGVGNKIGGPLPGVWATIALAGAASAYLKRRKNK